MVFHAALLCWVWKGLLLVVLPPKLPVALGVRGLPKRLPLVPPKELTPVVWELSEPRPVPNEPRPVDWAPSELRPVGWEPIEPRPVGWELSEPRPVGEPSEPR